ncbi:MAG: TlpA disulfide reductase family protein, partial [Cyclobacteriaceae bacterium]
MKKPLLLLLSIFSAFYLPAQVTFDKKAPEIIVDQWVDNPHVINQSIEGKAIVLDFWFTSCAPCVYTIPHLNDLAEKYRDKNIAFVAVSFEDPEILSKFLRKKKFLAQIASDTSYRTINNYQVSMYPTTFLIDDEGVLKWSGNASKISSELLDLLLDKEYYNEVMREVNPEPTGSGDFRPDLIYPITLVKNTYMDGASGMQFTLKEYSAVNKTLANVLADLTGKNEQRIILTDTTLYDTRFKIPEELPENKVKEAIIKSL